MSGPDRAIGSDRNRSKTPFSMSWLRFTPMLTLAIAMIWPDHAGQQELQVCRLRAARDRAAEDVGEQGEEDHRLQRDVDERLGGAEGLDEAALGEHERVPDAEPPPVDALALITSRRRCGACTGALRGAMVVVLMLPPPLRRRWCGGRSGS